jgi:diguanylate cyclase (GGDEF)-like protein
MSLVADQRSPVYVNLAVIWAANTFEEATVPAAIERLEAVHKLQQNGSPAEACTLIALGQLEHQADRSDLASAYLTRAYRMSEGSERRQQRVLAADTLALVMRDVRDFPQALALNQEVLDWDLARGATFNLATTRFFRAAILREMGEHEAAIAELTASRQLSEKMNDAIGVAYDDLLLCQSNIVLNALPLARQQCTASLEAFEAAKSIEPLKQALTGLAHIDLLQGMPAQALARLDRVLDKNGSDVVPRRLVQVYELRARAHAALGQYELALADYQEHMQRFKAASEADRASDAAAIRARFETDREIERNTFLQHELEIKNERLTAQSERLKWIVLAAFASMCMIGLLTYLLLANKKKKQLLARLAQVDDLTQLPNRRRTFELASEAFDLARRQCTPLTIGILDLDHFKSVNDRFGHAVGDRVLQEFARIGRNAVRGSDVFGRWGGEEFLVVLPNTTLDIALAIVDRVRIAASEIKDSTLTEELRVSVSAGLATNEGDPAHLEEIIASADAALYDAKEGGRDLICVAPESYSLASTGVRRVLKASGRVSTGKFMKRASSSSGKSQEK